MPLSLFGFDIVMRFQIYELLALPLLFVVISTVAHRIEQRDFLHAPRAKRTIDELEKLTALANDRTSFGLSSSAEQINEMIAKPNSELDSILGHQLRTDHWGNPYVCVDSGEQCEERWQFYSNGLDRGSQTNGRDPDDLNSWDLSNQYYKDFDKSTRRDDSYRTGLIWTLPSFVLIIGIRELWRRYNNSPS